MGRCCQECQRACGRHAIPKLAFHLYRLTALPLTQIQPVEAIDNGLIAAVGDVEGAGKREIDAAGHLVTPGFVSKSPVGGSPADWISLRMRLSSPMGAMKPFFSH